MAKQVHQDVHDNGLNAIKNGAAKLLLVSAFTLGDSYATVVGNKVAEVAVTPADFTITSSGAERILTSAAKTGTAAASSNAGNDLHFAFTDGVSKVLWVTDETTNQAVTAGNPVNIPALTMTAKQPT